MRDHLTRVSNKRHASVERKLKNFDILLTDYRECDYSAFVKLPACFLEVIDRLINQVPENTRVYIFSRVYIFTRPSFVMMKECIFHDFSSFLHVIFTMLS